MHRSWPATLRPTLFAATLPLLALTWQPALAASECKGLAQDVCVTNGNCRWMEGYTRKDGIHVSSHCRLSKPRQNNTSEIQAKAAAPADAQPATVTTTVKPAAMTADTQPETMATSVKPETATN